MSKIKIIPVAKAATREVSASKIPLGTFFYGDVPGCGNMLLLKAFRSEGKDGNKTGIVAFQPHGDEVAFESNYSYGRGASDIITNYREVNVTITVEE